VLEIDQAMRYGFNWERGPFELWDAVGVEPVVERWRQQDRPMPPMVEALLKTHQKNFYLREDGKRFYLEPQETRHRLAPERPGVLFLAERKATSAAVEQNSGASLIDLGDGVACLEFHTKMNAIGADILQMVQAAVKRLETDFDGLVVGNQGPHFSVGANLMLLLMTIQEEEWDDIDLVIRAFQNATMSLKYAPRPVVIAPHGMVLGGGCEFVLHGDCVQAAAETYIGLVEVGAGLIPAGGGTKEVLVRALDAATDELGRLSRVRKTFETVAMAKVATSAEEARGLGYLRSFDRISMNQDRLIADAKQTVLELVRQGYRPRTPRNDIVPPGETLYAQLKLGIHLMRRADYITDHDAHVASKLAYVITGGALNPPQPVSEQYILDLEREAFLSLCGEAKTQQRMQHLLKTGKPLRN
jgi:3-hydroxyacyl-CoA dehydrogenase